MEPLGNAGTPEERRTGIGGSEAAAALGLSPWQTPYELWELKTGRAPPVEQNEPMLWGQLLEDIVRREYARRTGLEARPVKDMIRHPQHPWMFVHLDGQVIGAGHRVILEVKTARTGQGWGEEETDEIPLNYLTQCHHALSVTQSEICDVAVLIGGQDFRLYQVRHDPEIEAQLVEGEAAFWAFVTSDQPPPPMTMQDAVRRWGRYDAQGEVMAGVPEITAVEVLRRLHRQQKELAATEEQMKKLLMEAMGDDGLRLVDGSGDVLVTWALDNGRKAYSVAAREPARRFLVKQPEDADVR
jgi:putative phage-type endonuclease